MPRDVSRAFRESPLPHRTTMLAMRETILASYPQAVETMSYAMPAYRIGTMFVAGLRAARSHVGYYPFSGTTLSTCESLLAGFSRTKSALHVPVDSPLPEKIIVALVTARLAEGTRPAEPSLADLGLAAPARRALAAAGIAGIGDLTRWREADLAALHGMGPNALGKLRAALASRGLRFAR